MCRCLESCPCGNIGYQWPWLGEEDGSFVLSEKRRRHFWWEKGTLNKYTHSTRHHVLILLQKQKAAKDRMMRAVAEMQEIQADPTTVKLGDASIASPFTARRTSIDSVLTVLRQGRCSLVTTIQVIVLSWLLVKINLFNCLFLLGVQDSCPQLLSICLHDVVAVPSRSQARWHANDCHGPRDGWAILFHIES